MTGCDGAAGDDCCRAKRVDLREKSVIAQGIGVITRGNGGQVG